MGLRGQSPRSYGGQSDALVAKASEERLVRGRELVVDKLAGVDPRHRLILARLDRAGSDATSVKVQDHGLPRVVPRHRLDLVADGEVGAQLLGELAPEASFECLTWLALATRKLPQPFEVRAVPAPRDEISPGLVLHERRGDVDGPGGGPALTRATGGSRLVRIARRGHAPLFVTSTGYDAQKAFIGHGEHRGRRGVHQMAPKSMRPWLKS